jgi:drug/metabolite transporter (DMT)-like permease
LSTIYGLLTAAGFGTADFFVTRASRRVGPLRSLYLIQCFGLIALLALVLIRREAPPELSITWLWMLLLGAVDFAGIYCLYRSFTVGSLAICSPIAASYAVVTGLLALATGERPPNLVLAGAVVLVIGVAIVARGGGGGPSTVAGVPEALAAALLLGIFFWSMDRITEEMGWLWPVVINRAQMLLCALIVLARRGEATVRPEPGTGTLLLAASLLDTLGFIAFNLGLEHGFTTTTTALGSLYSAVAVVLAWLFLRERLAGRQWAGIAVILTGVLLVSL